MGLKGILIGNGVTDWTVDTTPGLIDFAFTHGVYSTELRSRYEDVCKSEPESAECNEILSKIYASFEAINIYDIYRDCFNADSKAKMAKEKFFKSFENKSHITPWRYTPWLFKKNVQEVNEALKNSKKEKNLSQKFYED